MIGMSVIDEYLQHVAWPQKAELERVRRIVRTAAPDAVEVISYAMPGFKYRGKYLIGFAAFKDHLSIFPTAQPIEIIKDELSGFTHFKGTVQFTVDNPVPELIITELVRLRLAAIDEK